MFCANISTLPTLKIDLLNHIFIKDDIFGVNVNFPQSVPHIGIVIQYCEHHNMSYISQSLNNIPWSHAFTARNRNNAWMIITGRNQPTTFQQVLEAISGQQLTGKFNRIYAITSHRDKYIIGTNLQENKYIFNKIRHIQAIGNKLISLSKKYPTPDHIMGIFKSSIKYERHDSIFQNTRKCKHS